MADTTMVSVHEHDTIHSHAKANEETKETSKCVVSDQSVRVILFQAAVNTAKSVSQCPMVEQF